MSTNNDYTTGNLLDHSHRENCYKLIGTDLSRQWNATTPQEINFTRRLEEDDGGTMFFIVEKQQKTISNFSLG